ncbi:MAG: hypothetical protein H6591_09340 [Flavobacteriales bacterium]|nr:hypothetical protein [Flavobacteriales bacterium]
MRLSVLIPALLCLAQASAQTILFEEDFEGTPSFTLNTTDAGSTVSTWNTWVVNNSFTGGDGDVECLGFPLTYSIVNTPAQPGGISSANGSYLHTASVEGIADGITCCSFGAADGFCITADNTFSRMSSDVSTLGNTDVELRFWWLCQGGSTFYGQVWYSTNGGANWTQVPGNYNLQGSWTEEVITLPAFGNQASLRFGFRFVNSVGFGAQDPGFGIDDVRIIANTAVPASITTGAIAGSAFCQGATLAVPFTATGSFNAGNVFSAELSDASGSFAAPVVIGTLAGTASGSVACTIPALTPTGTGYRVRVTSSDPITVGSINTVDIVISSAPYAGADDLVTLCKNSGVYDLLDYLPGADDCGSWSGPGGGAFSGQLNTATDIAGLYTYTTNCPGGCPQDQAQLSITLQNPPNAGNDVTTSLCESATVPNLMNYVSGGELTGVFFYNGQPATGAALMAPGTYAMIYVAYGTAPCVNDTAAFQFTVNDAPDAGSSVSVTICADDPAVELFDLLGGAPDPNGTWTNPTGGAHGDLFNPASDAAGLYTYTVEGTPPCADDQAFVAIVIDPCAGVEEHGAPEAMRWLGQVDADHMLLLDRTVRALDVVDARGCTVLTVPGPFTTGVQRIALGGMSSGGYLLRAIHAEGLSTVRVMHIAR